MDTKYKLRDKIMAIKINRKLDNISNNQIVTDKKKSFEKENIIADNVDNINIITCTTCYLDTVRPINKHFLGSCFFCEKKI